MCKDRYNYYQIRIEGKKIISGTIREKKRVSYITKFAKNRYGDVFVTDWCKGSREKKEWGDDWGCYALEVKKGKIGEIRLFLIDWDDLDKGLYAGKGKVRMRYQCELEN